MTHQPAPQNQVDWILQSINEIHALLSALEKQINLEALAIQPEIETIETGISEEGLFTLEDDAPTYGF